MSLEKDEVFKTDYHIRDDKKKELSSYSMVG